MSNTKITRYSQEVSCLAYCYGGQAEFTEDEDWDRWGDGPDEHSGLWCRSLDVGVLEAENARLREALEFYAVREAWETAVDSELNLHPSDAATDRGSRARAALNPPNEEADA